MRGLCFINGALIGAEIEGDEHLGERGIELRAGAAFDFLQHGVQRQGGAVGAGGAHGVEGIGDADDAAHERDFFAGELVGIAAAVPAFVVIEHAGDDVLQLADVAEDLGADGGMFFDGVEFCFGEAAGFGEHGFGHADLADVVQQAGEVDAFALFIGEADFLREGAESSATRCEWPRV